MVRREATLEELESRDCIAKFQQCSGIGMSGLFGYMCEACLSFTALKIIEGVSLPMKPCSYCGSTDPVFGSDTAGYTCLSCCENAIDSAKETRGDSR